MAAGLLLALLVVTPIAFGGCGSSGEGGGGPVPPPGPLAVAASPAGGVYASAQNVSLTATGEGSSGAVIYYTTDLSEPDTSSTVYAGPIAVGTANTVLKFFAQPTTGDPTDVASEGYTFGAPGSIQEEWGQSGHGMISHEPWRHWDEDGEVQTSCAKCHSGDGFQDWAMDGTVDAPAALPLGLECAGCHDAAMPNTLYDDLGTYTQLDHVTFPSGLTATLAGDSNLCIACHQGRASKNSIDTATPNSEVQVPTDYDSYSFINIHYFAAAASYFGTEVQGGYEYAGEEYQPRNTFPAHPDSLSTCVGCHMREGEANHTWVPDIGRCLECHSGTSFATLSGSPGDNHTAIQTALTELYAAIQDYADTVLGYPVYYDDSAYPYWFNDNGGGSVSANGYKNFDLELLKAAYNFHFGQKEPCAYLHNGTYMRQLLHDSIVALGGTPTDVPPRRTGHVDSANMFIAKTQQFHTSGHDNAGGEPFRHWDGDPAPQTVPTGCARCHSSTGFADWALDGTVDAAPSPVSVVGCYACHKQPNLYTDDETRWDDMANTALRPVPFPSGDTADLGNSSNVCMGCHQGRESGVSVDTAIGAGPGPYSFINIHYYAAAAIFFGTDVHGGYQYRVDASYRGKNPFSIHGGLAPDLQHCIGCHMRESEAEHTWEPDITRCNDCHVGGTFETLSGTPGSNYTAIQSLLTDLYAAIQAYATGTIGQAIMYDGSVYPYFFYDNGGGANYGNRYQAFDATLLKAAYNYQVGQKEPCGYIHNGMYMRQILYDSLDDLDDGTQNNSVAGQTRP